MRRKKDRWPLNYGTTISQEMVRGIVHDLEVEREGPKDANDLFNLRTAAAKDGVLGWSVTRSNLSQMDQITALLDEGLRQGALGVGSTVGYARDGITTYEKLEAKRAAARYGRLTSVHTQFHANSKTPEAQLGYDEVLVNAMLLKAPLFSPYIYFNLFISHKDHCCMICYFQFQASINLPKISHWNHRYAKF
jgi:N-acyl-D-amino-acid deacylase